MNNKPRIQNLSEAEHGDEYKGELTANFSSNVWYDADHTQLTNHLSTAMQSINRYPEERQWQLRQQLATALSASASELLITNGSIEGIYLIAQAFSGATSLLLQPGFSEYEKACRLNSHTLYFSTSVTITNDIWTYQPDLVWLCTPNNPDGATFSTGFLETLTEEFPDTLFLFDVSFREFCLQPQPDKQFIAKHPNSLLLYSFTKRYAVPGLRMGYVYSNADLITKISRFAIPWSVNTLAAEAIGFFLNNYNDHFDLKAWLEEKEHFTAAIESIGGFECMASNTPFFLVRLLKGTSKELKQFLLSKKILVRDASGFFNNGHQYIRLLTLDRSRNQLLIHNLQEWQQH